MLQGERELARDNRTIGKFQLTGIPPAPRGMPQVEVTFDIDANGILHVSAKDKATGKEQKIRIEASSGLSDADIDKMVKDAEKNAAEDKKRREEIDARNRLDSMTYEVEKNAKEWVGQAAGRAQDGARRGGRGAARGAPRRRHERDQGRAGRAATAPSAAGQSFYAAGQAPADDRRPEAAAGGRRPTAAEPAAPRTTSSRPTTRSWTRTRSSK